MATTTDIGAATGNYINITGTTTITGLGTIQAGTRRIVNFNGILTLTYNATSLILPTSANITTAAGDIATFISLGSGNWICTEYQRKEVKTKRQRAANAKADPARREEHSSARKHGCAMCIPKSGDFLEEVGSRA